MVPVIKSALDTRKMKAESSAYNVVLWCRGDPFLVECVERRPSVSDGKNLRSGVWMDMVDQLECMVSMAAWTTNKNRTGARLSPCLTPDIELKINSASSILILILIFVYIFLIVGLTCCSYKKYTICCKSRLELRYKVSSTPLVPAGTYCCLYFILHNNNMYVLLLVLVVMYYLFILFVL